MKQLRLFLYNIITIVVVMITVSACSDSLGSQWVRTTDGTLFWASSVDTTMSFLGMERTLIVLQMARELCFVLIQRETLKANNLICFMERHLLKISFLWMMAAVLLVVSKMIKWKALAYLIKERNYISVLFMKASQTDI